jgi:hypothetical protein
VVWWIVVHFVVGVETVHVHANWDPFIVGVVTKVHCTDKAYITYTSDPGDNS